MLLLRTEMIALFVMFAPEFSQSVCLSAQVLLVGAIFGRAYDLDPDCLSFVESLRLIRAPLPEFQLVHPAHHDRLWQRLLRDIVRHRLSPRRLRTAPRVVKRKMSNFKLKRPEHRARPQPTQPFSEVIVLRPIQLPVLI